MEKHQDSISRYLELIEGIPWLFLNDGAPLRVITDKDKIDQWERNNPGENIGVVYEDSYILLIRDLVEFPSKKLSGYARLINKAETGGSKGIAVLPEMGGKILLLRQFRHATRSWHIEIPRGFGEVGISPEDNARKEIAEETDGTITELISLGTYHCNTGTEAVETQLFFAKLSSTGSPNREEGIEGFEWATVPKVEKLIRTCAITDGFTIAAFMRARLFNLI